MYSFVGCWHLDVSENRPGMPGEFRNVVLEEDGGKLDSSVKNEEVLQRVKENMNILYTIKRRKATWSGHIVSRNCLLKHIIEGKIWNRTEVTGRRGRIHKQQLVGLKKTTEYWKFKEKALYRTLWRTRFGRGYGPVSRQDCGMNEHKYKVVQIWPGLICM